MLIMSSRQPRRSTRRRTTTANTNGCSTSSAGVMRETEGKAEPPDSAASSIPSGSTTTTASDGSKKGTKATALESPFPLSRKPRGKHKRARSLNLPVPPPAATMQLDSDSSDHTNNDNRNSKKPRKRSTRITTSGQYEHEKKRNNGNGSSNSRSSPSPPNYIIRPMMMPDIATVYDLGLQIFTSREFPNMYRLWDDFAVVENFESSREFCFVAEIEQDDHDDDEDDEDDRGEEKEDTIIKAKNTNNGKIQSKKKTKKKKKEIVGFFLGETMTKYSVGTRGYIQWVAVLPAYRRFHIATSLLQSFKIVAHVQNVSLLLADTPASNVPAIRMFEKAGLSYKTDHVYLTRQLAAPVIAEGKKSRVDENGEFDFSYTAKKKHINIRNMEIQDLHPVYTIGERIFTTKSANLYNFWDEDVVLQSYQSDPELCVVATVKDDEHDNDNCDDDVGKTAAATTTTTSRVVGFAFGTTIAKPRSSWKYGYLVWLGVSPQYQGLGLATQLYKVMQELFALEKVRMLMIDTQQNNEGALKFFRKNGFGHDEEHLYLCNAPPELDG